jgi:glycosyltransferase involved in cell wall biosynthesis
MKISIVIPVSEKMKDGGKFLKRCLDSIDRQTFKNYEIITTNEGKVAHNINCGIKRATGDVIKILCQDDYFFDENSLQSIANMWPFKWLATACVHDDGIRVGNKHIPGWNDKIHLGWNTLGGLSVISFTNEENFYTEGLDWVVDVEFCRRMFDKYGLPEFIMQTNVVIGIGDHQLTETLTVEQKNYEQNLMLKQYGE